MNRAAPLVAAGTAMWNLVERHTGHVGYKGGAMMDKLQAIPPVIDCSGHRAPPRISVSVRSGSVATSASSQTLCASIA